MGRPRFNDYCEVAMELLFKKFLYFSFTLFLATTAIFFVVRLSPGDPVERILGPEATQVEIDDYRQQLGLDRNFGSQYITYLGGIVKGDMGKSLFSKEPVTDLMKSHLPPTVFLAGVSVFLAWLIGTFVGIYAATKKSGWSDNIIRLVTLFALAFPIFSLAPILVLIFAIQLQWLPVSEWQTWQHKILPVMTLVIPLSSIIARVARNKFLEECHAPWVQVLYAKGLDDWSVWLRITKLCMPTILNVVAIQLSVVLAGTMITETIFDIPGVGTLLFDSIQSRDYPVVQAAIIYSTIVYMLIYFLVDYINEFIDPRINNVENS